MSIRKLHVRQSSSLREQDISCAKKIKQFEFLRKNKIRPVAFFGQKGFFPRYLVTKEVVFNAKRAECVTSVLKTTTYKEPKMFMNPENGVIYN